MSEKNNATRNDVMEMFGLTYDQSKLMFSAQRQIVLHDIQITKNERKVEVKQKWLDEWSGAILTYMVEVDETAPHDFVPLDRLKDAFEEEAGKSENKTWYYIVVLELIAFTPYTPLGGKDDKKYARCKFDSKEGYKYLQSIVVQHGVISEEKIDRIKNTYSKDLSTLSGKKSKMLVSVFAVIAVTAISAAIAAIAAPAIAVAIVGPAFEGLHGAALVNACLALIGGGAIAIGGHGIVGGVIVIAGGGALLGLAGGGTAVGVGNMLLLSTPEYMLTQAAKLETVLKEVILNAQQDVATAQKILSQYKKQIAEMNNKIAEMERENEKNKRNLNNIKKSLKYMTKSYTDMNVFTSAYDIGMQTAG